MQLKRPKVQPVLVDETLKLTPCVYVVTEDHITFNEVNVLLVGILLPD